MLRTFGRTIGSIKRMAGDFQKQFDEALRDSELEELKREVSSNSSFAPLDDARKSMEEFQKNVKAEMEAKVSAKASDDAGKDRKPADAKKTSKSATKKRAASKAPARSKSKASTAASTKKEGKSSS